MWFWLLKWIVLGPIVRWFARPEVIGLERIPRSGPVILAANHRAEIDSLVLCLVLPRKPRFIAKAEYFTGTGLRGKVERWLCSVTGQIPVDRSGGRSAVASLRAAEEVLRAGDVWAIYPEGTRSPDGQLHRGRTGVARVALAVPGAAVVPVGITGTAEVDPRGRRGWRRGRVTVTFGKPMDLAAYDPEDPVAPRLVTDALMAAIGELVGQEPREHYASRS
ncbi:lysophospholipid acyltransferase family protein [Nocardioides alcanivorans]|uniref:lysophospholipid acyltransferase family protein n=1 Tax=Nocardioides alcanivorans TaxID=2897352 RepID=UPI001F38A124|nr:lysophospholipid acyltransferase family protein [Nocardioides alcanivorans]